MDDRERNYSEIIEEFFKGAVEFEKRTGALRSEIFAKNRDGKRIDFEAKSLPDEIIESDGVENCLARVHYPNMIMEFRYTLKAIFPTLGSILDCTIIPRNLDGNLSLPFSTVFAAIKSNVLQPVNVPYIIDRDAMEKAFRYISDITTGKIEAIDAVFCDITTRDEFVGNFKSEIEMVFNKKFEVNELFELYNDVYVKWLTSRLASDPYVRLFDQRADSYDKILAKLEKLKFKSLYDKSLIDMLKNRRTLDTAIPDVLVDNVTQGDRSRISPKAFKEAFAVIAFSFACGIIVSPLFLILYFSLYLIETFNALMVLGPLMNFPACFLAGFLTGIGFSYFLKDKILRMFFKKDFTKMRKLDLIVNGKKADKFMKGFNTLIIIASIFFIMFIVRWNVKFETGGIVDNSRFLTLQGTYYEYKDIEKVYYKSSRVNSFGDKLDYPSYVILLENGSEIDLYEFGEIDQYEGKLEEILKSSGVKFEKK